MAALFEALDSLSARDIANGYDGSIIFRRWLGAWVDLALLIGLLVGSLLAAEQFAGQDFQQMLLYLWVAVYHLYFIAFEGLAGYTVGKLIARIRVVDERGLRPGLTKATIRTLTRIVEVNPIFLGGVPAGFIAWQVSKSHQRLGDMLAGTYVIKTEDIGRISA